MPTQPAASAANAARARRALAVVVVLVLWGFGTHGTFAGSGDEPHYLAIAHSLAFDGDLDLQNNYGPREPLVAGGTLEPGPHVRDVGGTLRPVHDVGLPLIFAPFVRVAAPLAAGIAAQAPESLMRAAKLTPATLYRQIVSFASIALAVVLARLMFDALQILGASPRAAFWTTLLLIASPPLLAYSTLFFTELTSALLAFYAFTRLVLVAPRSAGTWALVGAATGLLVLVHARNVGLSIGLTVLAAAAIRRGGTRRDAAAFAAALAVMAALRTAITYRLWGTWLVTPHATTGVWEGWGDALGVSAMRLVALLVDQEYGLLVYAPIYVLSVAGAVVLSRSRPGVLRALAIVAGAYLALVLFPLTNLHGWSGQWCPAGRFLTPIVPLIGLPVYAALRAAPRAAAVLVVAVQVALSAYWWQHPKLLWNDGDGRAAFCATTGDRVCAALPAYSGRVR